MDNFELVKQKVNIVDVIEEDINLKRSGRVKKALCPFHSESTPSFTVYHDQQSFHCFGCGKNGTVIDYVMYREGFKEAAEALEYIAGKYDLPLDGFDRIAWESRKKIVKKNRDSALGYYKELIQKAKEIEQYIYDRGISKETAKLFGLGFNKENKSLTIPFLNTYGEVAGISERFFEEDKPKYINSAENEAFKKDQLLYGLDKARKNIKEKVYVVEGYFDVMAMHEMGLRETVAFCGQSITQGQANLLSKYVGGKTKVYFIPDHDKTGLKNAKKNITMLKTSLKNPIGVISLPNGCKDMNDYLLTGAPFERLKSEPHEMYLLKQDLDSCLDREDEYEIARQYAQYTINKMIRAEMASYLSKRWDKPIDLVRDHMNTDVSTMDYSEDLHSFSQSFNDYMAYLQKGNEGRIFTDLDELDKILKGMRQGEVCTLLGRSGAGKTTLLLNIIYNAIMNQGHNVMFNSLELGRESIIPQLIQIHNQESEGRVASKVFGGEADNGIIEVMKKMDEHLRIVDKGGQTLKDVEMYARLASEESFDKPVGLICIDYFQYLKSSDNKKSTYDQKSDMARELKEMAKRLKCVVLVLSQANREGGGSGSEKLSMTSARDTGAIEESSDYMLGVYRPAADPKLNEDERQAVQHEMYCQVLKNRWGRTGEVKLWFDGMVKKVENCGGRY